MSVALVVQAERWREHLRSVRASLPHLVPVAKGNGYGFGVPELAAQAAELGVETLAVGTPRELRAAASFPGSLLVLSPWQPFEPTPLADPRVVHTVSRLDDLAALAAGSTAPRVVVEVLTSMRRHGIDPAHLPQAAPLLDGVELLGWSLHLPLVGDTTAQAVRLAAAARAVREAPVWVSHVPPMRLAQIGDDTRLRLGTDLWLGARGAVTVSGRVLDVHRLRRGETFGYRQRRAPADGALVVVSGGTAHGVAMRAPSAAASWRQRGVTVAEAGMESLGRVRSPFAFDGRFATFAEPPHMQCSMVWLPRGAPLPSVGDAVAVRMRHTTALVDHIDWV
jgi:alanine racemase